uniref:Uncharacterized protein n=1 Tax=Arundo donax TaxID=35708 RepID=A0A0A9FPB4_ARUDO
MCRYNAELGKNCL